VKRIVKNLKKDGVDYFNRLVKSKTLPLIQGREALFLYHDPDSTVKDVRLVHHVATLDRSPKLHRIGENGLFALHLVLPPEARLEYTFGIIYKNGKSVIRSDPFNPSEAWCPFGPKSVLMTKQYKIPDWSVHREDIAHGILDEHEIKSTFLGDRRTFYVYLPARPPLNHNYPVLLIHDGTDYMNFAQILDVLDNLIADGEMAPVLTVFTVPGNRNEEYSCTPKHPAFLVKELLPWIRNEYAATNSREQTGLMGASFGAVAFVYTAYQYPDDVGLLLLQSGSLRFQDVIRAPALFEPLDEFDRITFFLENEFFPDGPKRNQHIFLSCGTYEPILSYNRDFSTEMQRLGHTIKYNESHDGHNWISWRDQFGIGLPYLFPADKNKTSYRKFSKTKISRDIQYHRPWL